MSAKRQNQHLYSIYGDIIVGFSVLNLEDEVFYSKHLTVFDLIALEEINEDVEKEGASKGFISEEEKLKNLDKTNDWKKEEEEIHQREKKEIENLSKSLEKIFIQSQRKGLEKELAEKTKKYEKREQERASLVGQTLDHFKEKRENEESIRISLYKDKQLTTPAFSRKEYSEIDDDFFLEIINKYNKEIQRFSEGNIKKIAVSGFFLNSFFLSDNNCFSFFGKRVIDLTFFQQNLFSKGILYKSILSQDKNPPESFYEDIDKLVGWFDSMIGAGESSSKKKGANKKEGTSLSAIVGASKEEMEVLANKEGSKIINIREEMEKYKKELKKDSLNTIDIVNLHERLGI